MSELTKGRLWAALSSLVVRQGKRPDHQDGARAAFAHYWLRAAAAVAHLNAPSPPPAARHNILRQVSRFERLSPSSDPRRRSKTRAE
jgi:hypothetical protein